MDEPCSALDPIATAVIEELIDELRNNFFHHHRNAFNATSGRECRNKPRSFHLGNFGGKLG